MLNRDEVITAMFVAQDRMDEVIVFLHTRVPEEQWKGVVSLLHQAKSLLRVRRMLLEHPPAPPTEGQIELPIA